MRYSIDPWLLMLAAALAACSGPKAAPPAPAPAAAPDDDAGVRYATAPAGARHPREVFDHPEWIGEEITLDIYQPVLRDDETSAAARGELHIDSLDVGTSILNISAGRDAGEIAAGALEALPSGLRSPFRVRGVLVRDVREARSGRTWRLLIARHIDKLPEPDYVAADAAAILAEPERYNGTFVSAEDRWLTGFEASYFGDDIWLDVYPDAAIRCEPRALPANKPARVRVEGLVLAGGSGYGHLGMAKAKIVARSIEFLEPRAPGCK